MNEIAGACTRDRFASFAPADFADAGEDVSDRLLLSMMMDSRPRSRLHLEQSAPDGRCNAERRRDGGATFEPDVCAVPRSNSAGLTMWIAADELMASRISLNSYLLN